jgi:HK97 family phage portal protein
MLGLEPEQRMITHASFPSLDRPGTTLLGVIQAQEVSLPNVTTDSALTVPAFWAGVSFLSRTLASVPKHVKRKTDKGAERVEGGLETLIHEAPNPEWTSFKLWQWFWQQVFTGGRGLVYIERSGTNIVALWPMDPTVTTVNRSPTGKTTYECGGKTYQSNEVIDVAFMLKSDGVTHYGPVKAGAETLQMALAMTKYGAKYFAGGGIPPLALEGPLPQGNEAFKRAMADVQRAIDLARSSDKPIFGMPPGHKLTQVAFDPDKGQMADGRRFQVEEIARLLNLPPVFLQDLTHGTFTNTEQQDLHLTKHVVSQWAEALDQEFNLKLFGQRNGGRYVEHNLDGLLRGAFKDRMEAHSKSIQNGIRTPNEVRELEGLPAKPKGDDLMIQGATVPLGSQPLKPTEGDAGKKDPDGEEDDDGTSGADRPS